MLSWPQIKSLASRMGGGPAPGEPRPGVSIAVSGPDGRIVEHPLAAGDTVLGRSLDADIVIPDLLQPRSLVLRLVQLGPVSRLTVTAQVPDISLNGRALALGKAESLVRDSVIRAGVITIVPKLPVAPGLAGLPGLSELSLAPAWIKPGLLLPGALGLLAMVALALGGLRGSAIVAAPFLQGRSAIMPGPGAAPDHGSMERAASELDSQLKGSWVEGPGKIESQTADVLLKGRIAPQEAGRLRDVVDAVSRRNAVKVVTDLTIQGGPGSRQIASILLVPRRAVVGIDRKRYGIGDKLPDGTEVKDITENSVTLLHDALEEVLRF